MVLGEFFKKNEDNYFVTVLASLKKSHLRGKQLWLHFGQLQFKHLIKLVVKVVFCSMFKKLIYSK